MRTDEFDYHLPSEAIAQEPLARRDASRLLVDRSLGPGDLTVDRTVIDNQDASVHIPMVRVRPACVSAVGVGTLIGPWCDAAR